MQYDPLEAPDPSEWLALDEAERILLVRSHHESAGIEMPNVLLHAAFHAAFHVAVENQIAMGDENPVRRALERLMAEELDRHEAIHAIGSVLAAHIHAIAKRTDHGTDPTPPTTANSNPSPPKVGGKRGKATIRTTDSVLRNTHHQSRSP